MKKISHNPAKAIKKILSRIKSAVHLLFYGPPLQQERTPEQVRMALIQSLHEASPVYLPELDNTLYVKWQWLVAAGMLLCPEYRLSWPQLNWWNDEEFTNYLEVIGEKEGFNSARRWNACQLMRLVSGVPGDMAECGVYRGQTAGLLLRACKERSRHLHLFDSFEGLSAPTAFDGSHWNLGNLAATERDVENTLSVLSPDYSAYTLYKGWIPTRFPEIQSCKFSFVHIDVDLYEPTKSSIDFFYPLLSQGGICVCDDYGFSTCPGATKAMDDFLKDKPEKMIYPASGAGFFIKGCNTTL